MFEQSQIVDGIWRRNGRVFHDMRGKFYAINQATEDMPSPLFKEVSASVSKRGVRRGMHCQTKQWQLVTVLHGAINDILIDIRPNSETFGEVLKFKISDENLIQLLIAPGIAHGFECLSPDAVVHYMTTETYNKNMELAVNPNSHILTRHWELDEPIMSPRDLNSKSFEDYSSSELSAYL